MAAARRAIRAKQAGNQVIVVVSARGDTTDELIELAREISEQPPAREMDMLLSTGEQISIALMAMAIQALGEQAISFTGAQIGIVTDSTHTKARIKSISTARMRQALDDGKIVIVAGFQGIDENYNITTLGRGGSDTTAVALAAVMKHDPAAAATAHGRGRLRNLHRRRRHLHHRPAHRSRGAQDGRRSATTRCWNWPASAPASCTRAASSSPRSSTCRCRCAVVVQRRRGDLDRARGRLDARRRRLRRRPGQATRPASPSTACRTSRASAIASSPPSPTRTSSWT